eukprot:760091-Pelagomonas_calceolata.AAC.3
MQLDAGSFVHVSTFTCTNNMLVTTQAYALEDGAVAIGDGSVGQVLDLAQGGGDALGIRAHQAVIVEPAEVGGVEAVRTF